MSLVKYLVCFFCNLILVSHLSVADEAHQPWEKISEKNGIIVYRKQVDGSDTVSFAGETKIAAKAIDAFQVLADNSISHDWMPMVAEKRILETINETKRIEYTHIEMPWPLTDRYFVNTGEVTYYDDGRIKAYIKSVENPDYQEADKVLGDLKYSEFVLTPVDNGVFTHIRIEINSDPRGLIPKWLVNMTQKSWPVDFFAGLAAQLENRGQLRTVINTAH